MYSHSVINYPHNLYLLIILILYSLQAQLRASVFLALEEQDTIQVCQVTYHPVVVCDNGLNYHELEKPNE